MIQRKVEAIARLETELAEAKEAGRKVFRKLQEARRRIDQLERDCHDLVAERDRFAGEVANARHMEERLLSTVNDLTQKLGRQPEVVVESILTGITPLFLGYRETAEEKRNRLQELVTSMGAQGLDNNAGVPPGSFFPDVEFDVDMEAPDKWPTPGEMTAHRLTNGGVQRTDGQPMFRTGTTSSPPVSRTE